MFRLLALFLIAGHAFALTPQVSAEQAAKTAAAKFVATPTAQMAVQQYPIWLAGQSRESARAAYSVFSKLDFIGLNIKSCDENAPQLRTVVKESPFALGPLVLALRCAELSNNKGESLALERQASALMQRLFMDGRGQLFTTPVRVLHRWDMVAICELTGRSWLYERFEMATDFGQLLSSLVLEDGVTQLQHRVLFDFLSDSFSAGLTATEFETPYSRFNVWLSFLMEAAAQHENDEASIFLSEFHYLQAAGADAKTNRADALKELRVKLNEEPVAMSAAIALVRLAALTTDEQILLESDLDPLVQASENGSAAAMSALALAHGLGLWDGADQNSARTLMQAVAKRTHAGSIAGELFSYGMRRKSLPWFALDKLRAEFAEKKSLAVFWVYALAQGVEHGKLPKEADWIKVAGADLAELAAHDQSLELSTTTVLGAANPAVRGKYACIAARFGIALAARQCLQSYRESETRRTSDAAERKDEQIRLTIASAGLVNEDPTSSSSVELAREFGDADPPQLDRAARWAMSAVLFGSVDGVLELADLALRGASLPEGQWQSALENLPEKTTLTPRLKLMFAFAGVKDRAKQFALLETDCKKRDAIACELLGRALERRLMDTEGVRVSAPEVYALCLKVKASLQSTSCAERLGQLYLYGKGVEKDEARGVALLEQQAQPSLMAINDMAWMRCTAGSEPMFAPTKVSKYWPNLIKANEPWIQDTLAACYAASGMFDLASAMMEKIIEQNRREVAAGKSAPPGFEGFAEQHLQAYKAGKRWVSK